MTAWILAQIIFNLFLVLAVVVMWTKLKRPPQDDPRLSRGLQLLQSKISVLEDLSDRTEVQVGQLTTLLDHKAKELQQKVFSAKEHMNKIDQSISKSMEVAEIFQDKIPHEEIVERQNTIKYVQAARLAHQGCAVDEIVEHVDLPRSEVEFIAKVNKDELMFDEDELPEWLQHLSATSDQDQDQDQKVDQDIEALTPEISGHHIPGFIENLEESTPDLSALEKLGDEFKNSCREFEEKQRVREEAEQRIVDQKQKVVDAAKNVTGKFVDSAEAVTGKFMDSAEEILAEAKEKSAQLAKAAQEAVQNQLKTEGRIEILDEDTPVPTREAKLARQRAIESKPTVKAAEPIAKKPPLRPIDLEIKKVQFPKIDINDNLG